MIIVEKSFINVQFFSGLFCATQLLRAVIDYNVHRESKTQDPPESEPNTKIAVELTLSTLEMCFHIS